MKWTTRSCIVVTVLVMACAANRPATAAREVMSDSRAAAHAALEELRDYKHLEEPGGPVYLANVTWPRSGAPSDSIWLQEAIARHPYLDGTCAAIKDCAHPDSVVSLLFVAHDSVSSDGGLHVRIGMLLDAGRTRSPSWRFSWFEREIVVADDGNGWRVVHREEPLNDN